MALDRYRHHVEQVRALGATTIASAHSPLITGGSIDTAFDLLIDLPNVEVPPAPVPPQALARLLPQAVLLLQAVLLVQPQVSPLHLLSRPSF